MVKINGKPILEIVINNIKQSGLKNIYLSVNHFKEQIIDYFGDGSELGLNINYLIEDSPLGTAGSLKLLPNSIKSPIIVANGDVLTNLNPSHLLNFHNDQNSIATLCVREEKIHVPFGVVETKGTELVSFQEKPTFYKLVNAGIYVIDPILLDFILIINIYYASTFRASSKSKHKYQFVQCMNTGLILVAQKCLKRQLKNGLVNKRCFNTFIPARGGSKGIPNKNIKIFDGKLYYVY